MLPIRDVIPSRTTPWITLTVLAVLLAAFGWTQLWSAEARIALQLQLGLAPAAASAASLAAHALIHVSWIALLSNAVVIGVLGETVEDRLGPARMAALLAGTTVGGAIAMVLLYPTSPYPQVGAAAAAGGVIGAHLMLFRGGRVLLQLPLAGDAAELPTLFLIGAWFLLQAIALGPFDVAVAGRPLFVLELAGAVAGAALAWLLRRRERQHPDWWSPIGRRLLPRAPADIS